MLAKQQSYRNKHKNKSQGFTLIELVVGIVLFSISMVTIVSVIMPQAKRGIDPIWQVRALSLGKSLLAEISSKAFDEASVTNMGWRACNPCTNSAGLGSDAESRNTFNDIDDYHNLSLTGVDIANTSQTTLTSITEDLFLGFTANVSVFYDDNADGVNDDDVNNDGTLDSGTLVGNRKLITVIVVTPDGEEVPFSTYRHNF